MNKCLEIGPRSSLSRDYYLCRKLRRSVLGLQDADIENYQNAKMEKLGYANVRESNPGSGLGKDEKKKQKAKRKIKSVQKKNNFEVS